jgi:hypothetical protein
MESVDNKTVTMTKYVELLGYVQMCIDRIKLLEAELSAMKSENEERWVQQVRSDQDDLKLVGKFHEKYLVTEKTLLTACEAIMQLSQAVFPERHVKGAIPALMKMIDRDKLV